jgi:hypothetical protein
MRMLCASTTFIAMAALGLAAQSAGATQIVPCENMLKDLRAAVDSAKLSDSDAAKVKDLEGKGIERCNADDDKRADDFFSQAMKIVKK